MVSPPGSSSVQWCSLPCSLVSSADGTKAVLRPAGVAPPEARGTKTVHPLLYKVSALVSDLEKVNESIMKGRTLGRIAGIEIRISWSILVIVGLLAWSLATVVLPAQADGYGDGAYWLAGALTASGLIAGILVHELAHALVARRNGVGVSSIMLWLFGGVAQLEGEAPNPGAEARIAGVGPATSFAVGLAAGALAFAMNGLGLSALAVASLVWLAVINVVLAGFNLLPGAPLDGGRLLHAFLWRRNGDRLRATLSASKAGRFVGLALVAIGLGELLFLGRAGGLWTAFIGWFLAGAARQEATVSVMEDALRGLTVADVMATRPPIVPNWLTVEQFLHRYAAAGAAPYYAIEGFDGEMTGVLTLADLNRVDEDDMPSVRLREIANPNVPPAVVQPGEPILGLVRQRGGDPRRQLRVLVVQAGTLLGVVTPVEIRNAMERRRLLRRVAVGA